MVPIEVTIVVPIEVTIEVPIVCDVDVLPPGMAKRYSTRRKHSKAVPAEVGFVL